MDKFEKRFEVGDVVNPAEGQGGIFEGYQYVAPFIVTESFRGETDRWMLQFRDSYGKTHPTAKWYQYRFELAYKGYDPKQTGDTDDDI